MAHSQLTQGAILFTVWSCCIDMLMILKGPHVKAWRGEKCCGMAPLVQGQASREVTRRPGSEKRIMPPAAALACPLPPSSDIC